VFLKILKFPKNPISSVKSPVALKISTVKSPEETLFFSEIGDFWRFFFKFEFPLEKSPEAQKFLL